MSARLTSTCFCRVVPFFRQRLFPLWFNQNRRHDLKTSNQLFLDHGAPHACMHGSWTTSLSYRHVQFAGTQWTTAPWQIDSNFCAINCVGDVTESAKIYWVWRLHRYRWQSFRHFSVCTLYSTFFFLYMVLCRPDRWTDLHALYMFQVMQFGPRSAFWGRVST